MRAYAHVGRGSSYKARCKVLGGHPIDPVHGQELILNSADGQGVINGEFVRNDCDAVLIADSNGRFPRLPIGRFL
jgi:hypothetical protein